MPLFRKRRISGWKDNKPRLGMPPVYLAFANTIQTDIQLVGPRLDWKADLEHHDMLTFGQMESMSSIIETAPCHNQLSLGIPDSEAKISLLNDPLRNDGEHKTADFSRYATIM